MNALLQKRRFVLVALLAGVMLPGFGCSALSGEHAKSRPWNEPENWEYDLLWLPPGGGRNPWR